MKQPSMPQTMFIMSAAITAMLKKLTIKLFIMTAAQQQIIPGFSLTYWLINTTFYAQIKLFEYWKKSLFTALNWPFVKKHYDRFKLITFGPSGNKLHIHLSEIIVLKYWKNQ